MLNSGIYNRKSVLYLNRIRMMRILTNDREYLVSREWESYLNLTISKQPRL